MESYPFPHHRYLKVVASVTMSSFYPALILLVFLLIGASPRIWRKTVRQQHVASLLYRLAEVLHSTGSGGTFFGDDRNWRKRIFGQGLALANFSAFADATSTNDSDA